LNRIALFSHGGVAQPGSREDVPSIAGLIRRLSEAFDIMVYLPVKSDGYSEPFRCGNARVRYIGARHDDGAAGIVARLLLAFRRDHRERRFSLVHGFWALPGGLAAVAAAAVSGIPSIVSILGGEAADIHAVGYGNMSGKMPREATLWTCRRAAALVALTRFQVNLLGKYGFTRSEGVHVIPFGAEPPFFGRAAVKPPPPPYNLLHVANINLVKDQGTLLRALKRLSRDIDCRLRIVGKDTLGGSIERLARELGIADRVTFTGFVPHEDLPAHYDWAHVLVHSSLYEGEGVVFAEASAAQVPICGTGVGLLADLGDSMGLVSDPGDDRGLAEAVRSVLSDGRRRENLLAAAGAWSAGHDALWTASRYARLYGELS
jgi:glycosyltransferase involved in cell wall biosynthesis